ncbi:hypothetical protein Fot_10973 [Forsythia ovata]|uniref:Uncharacterized protein n=1 Tax=Forsythia ovata TaxID=205694 RepID=A0ABD1WL14_9LAMI
MARGGGTQAAGHMGNCDCSPNKSNSIIVITEIEEKTQLGSQLFHVDEPLNETQTKQDSILEFSFDDDEAIWRECEEGFAYCFGNEFGAVNEPNEVDEVNATHMNANETNELREEYQHVSEKVNTT